MSAEEITSSVETIEIEAEKILEEARNRANEILLKAKEETSKILSSKMPLGEVNRECEQILHEANEEANKKIEESKRKASEIRTDAGRKGEKITERLVSIITGAELS